MSGLHDAILDTLVPKSISLLRVLMFDLLVQLLYHALHVAKTMLSFALLLGTRHCAGRLMIDPEL